MKYKTKIIPENDGYVGYVILNEETVYTSNNLRDPVAVTRELASFITSAARSASKLSRPIQRANYTSTSSTLDNNVIPIKRPDIENIREAIKEQSLTTPPSPPPPKRCCGRG